MGNNSLFLIVILVESELYLCPFLYIYIYSFCGRFDPKRLTVGYKNLRENSYNVIIWLKKNNQLGTLC